MLLTLSAAWAAASTRQEQILHYQERCEQEAQLDGAPPAFAQDCCHCLSRRLSDLEVIPTDSNDLEAFTQQHLADCIVETILKF